MAVLLLSVLRRACPLGAGPPRLRCGGVERVNSVLARRLALVQCWYPLGRYRVRNSLPVTQDEDIKCQVQIASVSVCYAFGRNMETRATERSKDELQRMMIAQHT